jgi:hypothetical protein
MNSDDVCHMSKRQQKNCTRLVKEQQKRPKI